MYKRQHYDWAYKLVDIAVINIILMIGNLVPIPGLDGEKALSILCGCLLYTSPSRRYRNNSLGIPGDERHFLSADTHKG